MDQRIIELYDEFTHCHLDRRLFLQRLSALVGSTAAALALLPQLESSHAAAQTVPESDARLKTEDVTYPGSKGTVRGYVARPAAGGRGPASWSSTRTAASSRTSGTSPGARRWPATSRWRPT